jgi:hypothetical protein
MFFRILFLSATRMSILESTSTIIGNRFRWVAANLWKLPEGFQFTLLGLVLIGIFVSRMAFGNCYFAGRYPECSRFRGESGGLA